MKIRSFAMAFGSLLVAAPAFAQDPKFAYEKPPEEKDTKPTVEWKASAQAGLMLTSGNSRSTTFSAGANGSRKQGRNKFGVEAGWAYTESELRIAADANGDGKVGRGEIQSTDQTTANAWFLKGRYDFFLAVKDSLFLAGRVGGDKPAGKELTGGGQIGYSRTLAKTAMHDVVAELGYDFTYESYVADVDALNIHSIRAFLGYTGTFSDTTSLVVSGEYLTNVNEENAPVDDTGKLGIDPFGDNRFTGKLALTTKFNDDISLRFGFTARLDTAPAPLPPVPGSMGYEAGFAPLAEELDTTTELTLIINLL